MTSKTIGRYEIESEIGHGGMAAVYLAYDPRFRRKVAIKLVSIKLQENRIFRERFEREAQLIARIEHPGIVPVYDFGEQDDQPYLVMRYMPGGALAGRIKQGPMTVVEASQIVSQIAPALDAVHAQGIVHRDLKPANILLDGFGNPAISDFGIAHFTQATTDLTGSAVIGTPAYMSPEQIRGDEGLDGRSDIYALGIILFEMLHGSSPFRAATPMSAAMKHLTESIPSLHALRPDLPPALDTVLQKALAKQREMRYASAAEMARDLQSVANSASVVPATLPTDDAPTELYDDATNQQAELASAPSAQLNTAGKQPMTQDMQSAARPRVGRQPSSRILRMAAIAVLAIFLLFLCGSIGAFGTWAGLSGLLRAPSPTSPPTVAASPTEQTQQTVLFGDDFSDRNSGWPSGQDAVSEYGYRTDSYYIASTGTSSIPWVSTDRVYEDTSISVDAQAVSAGAPGSHGLLCRIQGDQNFYYFVITTGGSYAMGKYVNGISQPFFAEGWRSSDTILRGNQLNRLKADCIGSTLRFYVNDVLLAEVTDSDFTSGMSGLSAASLSEQTYEASFDNFLIAVPNP